MLYLKIKKYFNNEKDKQLIKNMTGSFVIKGGALFISLLTMPAYIKYFDSQFVLGIWFTLVSVMSWILSFDFGIGNGLRNKLVESIIKNSKIEIKEYISSAYVIIAIIVVLLSFFGLVMSKYINWNQIFNISNNIISAKTMLFTVRCVFIGIMLQFLLRLITSVLYAMQKSALTNLLSLITSVLQLTFVLIVPSYDVETNLKMLALAYLACANLPLFLASIMVFNLDLKGCAPSSKFFNKEKAKSVLYLGGIFFWCQIMYMIITTTNEFFITQLWGPEFVVEYQVYNRLYTMIGSLFMLALTPMWSAITKALNERDTIWIDKIYKQLNKLTLLAVCCEFLMIPFLQIIFDMWLGQSSIVVNYIFAVNFAVYGSLFIYQSVLSTVVCGMGKMKLQLICYTIGVFVKFVIIYFGMKLYDTWIVVIIANSIILLPYCILQPIYIKREILN